MADEPEVTEASQLGWAPGCWPDVAFKDGAVYDRVRDVREHGELVAVVYRARVGGQLLEVLND